MSRRMLTGWKAIASELGVEVRTAQRYADRESDPLPTYNTPNGQSVVAYSDELSDWSVRDVKRIESGGGKCKARATVPRAAA